MNSNRFLLALATSFIASSASAATVLTGTSTRSKAMTLTFAESNVTTDAVEAIFCSTPAAGITEAKLWMPAHGHGSTPTTLTLRDDGCTDVTDIDFSMDGRWQVQIKFADGDRGVINVDVD